MITLILDLVNIKPKQSIMCIERLSKIEIFYYVIQPFQENFMFIPLKSNLLI